MANIDWGRCICGRELYFIPPDVGQFHVEDDTVACLDNRGPCRMCQKWLKTGRPCTALSHGDCDCPFCMGLCECHLDAEDRSEWGEEDTND